LQAHSACPLLRERLYAICRGASIGDPDEHGRTVVSAGSCGATATRVAIRHPLVELPGAHMAYLGQPRSFAAALRPLLARFT
jgi:hypothetical protein